MLRKRLVLTKRRGMLDTQTRGVGVNHTEGEIGVGHMEEVFYDR